MEVMVKVTIGDRRGRLICTSARTELRCLLTSGQPGCVEVDRGAISLQRGNPAP